MIRSATSLLGWLTAGATVAKAFGTDAPSWVIVETGDPVHAAAVQDLDRWSPLAIVQRDLFGAPYQLGLSSTPPRRVAMRADPHLAWAQ